MPRKAPQPTATGGIPFLRCDETFVYRAYCHCDDLLYVGITNDLHRRINHHHRLKAPWTAKAARLEWDVYQTREDAERAERRYIQTLYPLFNERMAMPRPPRSAPLPWPRPLTETELDQAAIASYRGTPYLDWAWSTLVEEAAA